MRYKSRKLSWPNMCCAASGVAVTVTVLFASLLAASHGSSTPGEPDNMFCYTTARGVAESGGSIKLGKCGEACGAKTNSSQWIGWLGVLVAIVALGSNYVPVKKFDTGDGMFFQWLLCLGIWLVGLVANMIRHQPPFFLSSLVAGLCWSVGNVLVVPIVKMIGLALGMTLWSSTILISGWISGVFILNQEVLCAPLNYVGIVLILVSVCLLLFVRSEVKTEQKNGYSSSILTKQTMILDDSIDTLLRNKPREDKDQLWVDRLGVWPRRILGVSTALFAGCIFGFQFIPIEFLKLCNDAEHSCEDIDYLFGYYTGIMTGSTVFLAVYCAYMNNRPRVYPRAILPGITAGIMWGVGTIGVFFANKHLSLAVSIPFITTGGQFVSSGWGILLFKEIKGWRYILLYVIALGVSVCGLVLEGLSRCAVDCHIGLHTSHDHEDG